MLAFILQHPATPCNTLQHPATPCNTLQHTATPCRTENNLQQDNRCESAKEVVSCHSTNTHFLFHILVIHKCMCVEWTLTCSKARVVNARKKNLGNLLKLAPVLACVLIAKMVKVCVCANFPPFFSFFDLLKLVSLLECVLIVRIVKVCVCFSFFLSNFSNSCQCWFVFQLENWLRFGCICVCVLVEDR